MSKWLLSELIRVFHGVTTDEATAAVDVLIERTIPTVWKVGGKLRVLEPSMSMRDKTLLLLYHRREFVQEEELCEWVEHSNASVYRRDVLRKAHNAKLIEYDSREKTVEISPLGVSHVEDMLLE